MALSTLKQWLFNLFLFATGLILFIYASQATGEHAPPAKPHPALEFLAGEELLMKNPQAAGWLGLAIFFLGCIALLTWAITRKSRGKSTTLVSTCPWTVADIFGIIGIIMLMAGFFTLVLRFSGLTNSNYYANSAFIFIVAETVGILYGVFLIIHRKGDDRELGFTAKNLLPRTLRGTFAWFAFFPCYFLLMLITFAIRHLVERYLELELEAEPVILLLRSSLDQPGFILFLLIFIIIGAPVVEEILFRGFLYKALRRHLAIVPAAILCGLLFGVVHGNIFKLIPITGLGVFLCILREHTGSLAAPIAAHIVNNTIMVIIFMVGIL